MADGLHISPTEPMLLQGDCLELMNTLPAKSVDLFLCDLPYGETNCSWDTAINMVEFWKEFKRIRRSKKTACIHFCSSGFGYSLIKSWEKGFKMDMVWKKRNKTGGLQSRFRPMRNHEMIYFFYEQAPKYNRDKYHKRIRTIEPKQPPSVQEEKMDEFGWKASVVKEMGTQFAGANFDPPNPASVQEEKMDEFGWKASVVKEMGNAIGIIGANFNPPNPASVQEDNSIDIFDEIEEPHLAPFSVYEGTKCFIGKRNHQTEKPQDILEFILKYWTDEGDVVLDPTMGSGSTGVACKKMGRSFIGIELTDKYFGVANKRIRQN